MALLNQRRRPWQVKGRSGPRACSICPNVLAYVLLLLGVLVQRTAHGQTSTREYELKAVFLYNFIQFTEWPTNAFPSTNSPVVIGVLGEDPFGQLLEATVQNETMNGRRVTVQRYRRVDDIKECHVLFISGSETRRLGEIFARLANRNILTVGEADAFTESGGMIGFVLEKSRIRFKINAETAKRENLTFSSKLLRLGIAAKD